MKKYTVIYIIVFIVGVIASTLFNSLVPDFKFKSMVSAIIMIVPILGYSVFYAKAREYKSENNINRLNEYLENFNPENPSPFEGILLDYSSKNLKENFRYMEIADHLFFEQDGEFKLLISGIFNLKAGKNKIKIDILFQESIVYVDINSKGVSIKLDIEYPKKGIYKVIEKEVCTKISEI